MLGRRVDNEPWLRGTDYTRPKQAKSKVREPSSREREREEETVDGDPTTSEGESREEGRMEKKRARSCSALERRSFERPILSITLPTEDIISSANKYIDNTYGI